MTCTKNDLINSIYLKDGFSKEQSSKIFDSILSLIKTSLISGEAVLISGFGKFYLTDKKLRKGRNPSTGEDLMLNARRIVCFRCSGKLRDKVNA
jgi:integration host factor subunit alpha